MDMPDKIWVKENDDDVVQCRYVADTDRYMFTDFMQAEKYVHCKLSQSLADALEGLIDGVERYETPETEETYGQSITGSWPVDEPLKKAIAALANYRKGE